MARYVLLILVARGIIVGGVSSVALNAFDKLRVLLIEGGLDYAAILRIMPRFVGICAVLVKYASIGELMRSSIDLCRDWLDMC
ncbi:hypothetical protein [Sporosarcina saromensis]|uniref:hypothetical protein n=1 Tax=Sporosarcina saromensis TaxID=359365 RepID=UPI00295E750E|nr:hypothetical protein [Sporosarcina saromensis]